MTSEAVKVIPEKTYLNLKTISSVVVVCFGLFWAASDFKSWVTGELTKVREEQVKELNNIGILLTEFSGDFKMIGGEVKGLAGDVSEIKSSLSVDRQQIRDLQRENDQMKAWVEQTKSWMRRQEEKAK